MWVNINGNWIGRHSGKKSWSSYWTNRHPELKAYITGLTTTLSTAQIISLGRSLDVLKSGLNITSLSEAFDIMYFLDGDTEESSLKNIVSDNYHCQQVGNITWAKGGGFTGDGLTGHLKTGYKPKSHGIRFGLNSGSIGVYCNTNIIRAQVEIGCRKGSTDDRTFINCQSSADIIGFYVNTDGVSVNANIIDGDGLAVASRTANNLTTLYKDGKKILDSDKISSDLPDYEIYISALNSADTLTTPSNNQIRFAFAGKGFSEAEQAVIHDAIITYGMTLHGLGYCWFVRKVAYDSSANKSFIGLVCRNTQYVLTINDSGAKSFRPINGSVIERDDHIENSILIRNSDKKLLTSYTFHNANGNIYFKISTNALDATSWGNEIVVAPYVGSKFTYTNLYEVTNGDIYVFYRESNTDIEGAWGWSYMKSSDGGATWDNQVRFLLKRYVKIAQDSNNKNLIHFLACDHPQINTNPNTVSHFYFNAATGTFHKSDGTNVTSNIPLTTANMTSVFSNAHPKQAWQEDIIIDSNGYARVLFTYYPDVTVNYATKYLYYSEWNGTAWSTPHELHLSTNRNLAVNNTGGEESYTGLSSFDLKNPGRIIAAKDVDGVMQIFELTRVASDNFTSRQITNALIDQWRPFTTPSVENNVMWLNKDSYVLYVDFNQSLVVRTI